MSEGVMIAVEPKDAAATPQAVDRLERWLGAQEEFKGLVRPVDRPDADPAMGVVQDLLVELGPDSVQVLAGALIRSLVAHLKTQRNDDLNIVIHNGEERLDIQADGMDRGRLEELELRIRQWLRGS
ncbi:effector-associated constant component EACC1 [Streptomyces boninensis]|uniref:effector-associated constant component EACC1 n=1 Tax=Streptomyces boninensis TaxID=2039455 RepID=UPI003B221C27